VVPGSALQLTALSVARSYHALLIIPCLKGSVPVPIVLWPTQVRVLKYGYAAFRNDAPPVIRRFNPCSSKPA
jgi:hypothetical protein